jgi:hypothetical protein
VRSARLTRAAITALAVVIALALRIPASDPRSIARLRQGRLCLLTRIGADASLIGRQSMPDKLKAARDLSHYHQDEQDDQNQSQCAARSVTPIARVAPGRQSAHEEQNNDDEQKQSHG